MLEKIKYSLYCASIFAIAPLLDIKFHKVKYKIIYRMYSIAFVSVVFLSQLNCLFRFYKFEEKDVQKIITVFAITEGARNVFHFIESIVTSIGGAYWNMEAWKKLHKKYSKLEQQLCQDFDCFFIRNYNLLFFSNFSICVSMIILINCIWSEYLGFFEQSKYFIKYLYIVCQHVKLFLAFSYTFIIYHLHKKFNNLIVLTFDKRVKILPITMFIKTYRKLGRLVQEFNDIFGIPIFLSILQSSLFCLNYTNMVQSENFKTLTTVKFPLLVLSLSLVTVR